MRLFATLVLALLVAGCSSPDSRSPTPTPGAGTPTPSGTGSAMVSSLQFRDHAELGPILADGQGRTLYIFTNDEAGVSNCSGQCATNWPPAMATAVPTAPSAIQANITLVSRDGGSQVAYLGWPLYYWQADKEPGQATGDAVGGNWFVVREPGDVWVEGDLTPTGENVTYFNGLTGYYADPGQPGMGIVMIHEWWGLNDNMRAMADNLASHGYHVLAVDLFGQVATTQEQARAQVQALNQSIATSNMQAAADLLRAKGAVGVASLGWCFGGAQSLRLAVSGEPLVATVLYYGTPVTNETQLRAIDWPVLAIFAEDDQAIPLAQAKAFAKALDNASVEAQVLYYPDVGHAFANPTGDAYAPVQTQDAWLRTLAFLEEHNP